MPHTLVHFVRHGQVHNPHEKYYGRLPGFRLSGEGLCQARAAAKTLSRYPIAAVYSSPLERAIETADEILNRFDGLDLRISELLSEAYTPFDGQPLRVVAGRNWDVYTGTDHPYEQPSDVVERVKKFVANVRREFPGRQVVATTHADVIAFMMLWSRGEPVTAQHKHGLYEDYMGYASITSFVFETDSEDEIPGFRYSVPYG